jgi:hypothetical protein
MRLVRRCLPRWTLVGVRERICVYAVSQDLSACWAAGLFAPAIDFGRRPGFRNVPEVNFGETRTPDRSKANMRAYMWAQMKDWLLKGAIETDEKMAMNLAGPGYHINRSNLLVLESKADMQKRGQASPDHGDALALTFAQAVAPAEKEERDEEDEFGGHGGINGPGSWMR